AKIKITRGDYGDLGLALQFIGIDRESNRAEESDEKFRKIPAYKARGRRVRSDSSGFAANRIVVLPNKCRSATRPLRRGEFRAYIRMTDKSDRRVIGILTRDLRYKSQSVGPGKSCGHCYGLCPRRVK